MDKEQPLIFTDISFYADSTKSAAPYAQNTGRIRSGHQPLCTSLSFDMNARALMPQKK